MQHFLSQYVTIEVQSKKIGKFCVKIGSFSWLLNLLSINSFIILMQSCSRCKYLSTELLKIKKWARLVERITILWTNICIFENLNWQVDLFVVIVTITISIWPNNNSDDLKKPEVNRLTQWINIQIWKLLKFTTLKNRCKKFINLNLIETILSFLSCHMLQNSLFKLFLTKKH